MDNCALPVGVNALACAIARQIENTDDLVLLRAPFAQHGDTLDTIAASRSACGGGTQKLPAAQ